MKVFKSVKNLLTSSVSDLMLSPVAATTAPGVSLSVFFANTPTVGNEASTIPIAS